MATDLERLVVQLSADIKGYERALAKARGVTIQSSKAIQDRFSKMNKGISDEFMSMGKALAAGISIAAVKDLIDSAVKIENQLKMTGLSGKELASVYDQLFASAQRNGAPVEALVTLYSRASAAAEDLHASQSDLISFSDGVAVALRASGQSAQESAGALLQLGQALGNGRVQAEEYNSLLDGGRTILQAVASGMKEAGGSIGKLTKLVKDGKVSSEAFFRAFLAGKGTLEKSVAGAETTVSQSLTRIRNALIDAAGRFNDGTKSAELFGRAASQIAGEINSINFDSIIAQIQYIVEAFNRATQAAGGFLDYLGRISGLQNLANDLVSKLPGDGTVKDIFEGTPLAGSLVITPQDAVQRRINGAFDLPNQVRSGLTPEQIQAFAAPKTNAVVPKGGRLPAATKPVSLSDFPVTDSKSGSKKVNEFDAAVKSSTAATDAIRQQEEALRGLSGTEADYATKVAAVEKAQELLSAAQKGGRAVGKELSDVNQLLTGDLSKLSPEARDQALVIRELSLSYADATVKLDKLKEAQNKAAESAREAIEFQKDLVNGALSDMRSALEDGKLTWEDLGNVAVNVLNKIADRLQNMLVDQLFDKGLGGLFGSLPGLGGAIVGGATGGSSLGASPVASRAPSLPNVAAAKAASRQDVHVTVGLAKRGLNIEPEVVDVASRVGKVGLAKYDKGQGRETAKSAVRNPRRVS